MIPIGSKAGGRPQQAWTSYLRTWQGRGDQEQYHEEQAQEGQTTGVHGNG